MNDETFQQQLDSLINGTISQQQHHSLQVQLKSDPLARAVYLERMDLEAGLRTLAAEETLIKPTGLTDQQTDSKQHPSGWKWRIALTAIAGGLLLTAFWWQARPRIPLAPIVNDTWPTKSQDDVAAKLIGRIVEQEDCRWKSRPRISEERFSSGTFELLSGAAELRFDSGTNVVLESPCQFVINAPDSAQLLAGTVFVEVTEVSNGFLLETPESQIVDVGTQYAVTLDSTATEVHVFDGSVIWTPTTMKSPVGDQISTGEARRYLRSHPSKPNHIPFGERQFVRRIEAHVFDSGGGELIAYDGFENLAGQLRRGRSGFGWSSGWQSTGRGRGPLAEVVDAPSDSVFGFDRTGRKLLSMQDGKDLRRTFQQPQPITSGSRFFVSTLLLRKANLNNSNQTQGDSSLQIFLEPESNSPRYTRRHSVSFGITSENASFLNNSGKIEQSASAFANEDWFLVVFRFSADGETGSAVVRVYHPDAMIDATEPTVWTTSSLTSPAPQSFSAIRIASGANATWNVDELRIGTSWSSVTSGYPQTSSRQPSR